MGPSPGPVGTPDPMGISTKGDLYTYIHIKQFMSYHLLLSGRKVDQILRELGEHLSECLYRFPSCLFLDDLDTLCRAGNENEQQNPAEQNYLKG